MENGQSIRDARVDLAAALRLAVRFGLNEGIDNHFSFALPGDGDRFLLNPYGLHWSEVTASRLHLVDADGTVIEGDGPWEPSAFYIHSRIHLGHPAADCVLHTHMPHATALTLLEDGRLEPLSQTSIMFYGEVAYDPEYNGLVEDREEGDRIARAMDGKRVLFMANHGVTVVGESIAEAFTQLYYLERACQAQVLAMSTGRPLKPLGGNRAAATHEELVAERKTSSGIHFDALKRLLDREEPDYAA